MLERNAIMKEHFCFVVMCLVLFLELRVPEHIYYLWKREAKKRGGGDDKGTKMEVKRRDGIINTSRR